MLQHEPRAYRGVAGARALLCACPNRHADMLPRLALLAALLLPLAACEGDDDAPGAMGIETVSLDLPVASSATAFIPTLAGPLRLLAASPTGTLAAMPDPLRVAATFSQPLVPLGDAPEPAPDALVVTDASGQRVPGALRWVGTQTLAFEPAAPLPPATAFTARLSPALAAPNGTTLGETAAWTFETPRPALVRSAPAAGAAYFDPDADIVLRFNQAVDAAAAAPYMRLYAGSGGGTHVKLNVLQASDSTLVPKPHGGMKAGTAYRLVLREGLPSAAGPLGAKQDSELRFQTRGPLRVMRLRQGYGDVNVPFDPARPVVLELNNPVRFGDLREALAISPEAEWEPGAEGRDETVSTSHALPLDLAPETRYTLTVRGLDDTIGGSLAQAATLEFRTGALRPSFAMPSGVLVIEARGQAPALPVRVTNIPEVQVAMQRVPEGEIARYLSALDYRFYQGEASGEWDEDARRRRLAAALPNLQPIRFDAARNTRARLPLSLEPALGGAQTGVVAVRVEQTMPGNRNDIRRTALVQLTKLSVTAKFSPHQNLVLVTTLEDAEPVAGATVTIRSMRGDGDNSGAVLWSGQTDGEGRALGPGWNGLGITPQDRWSTPTVLVTAEKSGDLAFITSQDTDGLEPYRFDGVDAAWQPEAVTHMGSVFSDRGLYREGETVHLKGILRTREDGDWRVRRDSVRVLVESPRGAVVLDRRLAPSSLGSIALDWDAPDRADLGGYLVRVVDAGDADALTADPWERDDLASGFFRVDAFRRATFAVEARAEAPSYVAGDFAELSASGRYLFGASMGGAPVRYALRVEPSGFTPPGLDAYRFGTLGYQPGLYQELASGDTTLDAEGMLRLREQVRGTDRGTPLRLRFSASVTAPDRQELTGETDLTLHPGLFYVGLRPRTTFLDLTKDKTLPVDIVTVDPEGRGVSAESVEVEVVRQQWNSVREVGADGRLRWRTEQTEEPVATRTIATEAGKATRLNVPLALGGSYLIRATGRDLRGNAIRSEARVYATGRGYTAWAREDDDRIDLVADQRTYAPGETARILVASPYEEATALVTVEREGIISSRVVTLVGSSPQVDVPITEAHLPNVFVSITLLHGRSSEPGSGMDAGAPSFKIGYVPLRVDAGARHLRVAVEANESTVRPGDEVVVNLKLEDQDGRGVPGEITFSAADAAVLNLLGYALPDPFETFYGPRPLRVTTAEGRARLVRQQNFGQKEEDAGGGGGMSGDQLRRDFRPLAHWAPSIQTDSRGRAEVRFRVPESLTTFRLMATAHTADHQFGAGRTDVIVTQPLVLQPALPRFARRGDTFEAGVLVTNTTGKDGSAVVTAEGDGLMLVGPGTRSEAVADGATREVRFRWRADEPGTATLRFRARLGGEEDAFETTIPLALPTEKTVTATYAAVPSGAGIAEEGLRLPADRVPSLGSLYASLSSTALVGLDGATQYLFSYPYGCLEQRTSKVRPLLVADDLLALYDLDALDGDREDVIEDWIADLDGFWVGDGFGMWKGSREAHWYVTAYTVLALAEARDAGYDIPATLTAQAVDALASRAKRSSEVPRFYDTGSWRTTRALQLYALARHGRFLTSEIVALADLGTSGQLDAEAEAHLLRLANAATGSAAQTLARYRAPLAERLLGRLRVEADRATIDIRDTSGSAWIFASDTRATALALAALSELPVDALGAGQTDALHLAGQRMVRALIASRTGGHWATTQDNAAVLDGLRAYSARYESAEPDFTAAVKVAGTTLLDGRFRGRTLHVEETERALGDLAPEASAASLPITVEQSGTGIAYYSLRATTYTDAPVSARDDGLRLTRTIQRVDDRGQPSGAELVPGRDTLRLEAGALVRVTLRLTSPTDRTFVVVDDALPAGLEALNPALATTDDALTRDTGSQNWWGSFNHEELRDDRVVLFADWLRRGEHTYVYLARATTPGAYRLPAAYAEQMYAPAVNGRTSTGALRVVAR